MCSSVPSDAMDTIPNESVSGANVHPSVERNVNVISAQFLNTELEKVASTPQVDSVSTSITTAEASGDNTSDHMPSTPPSVEPIETSPKSITLDDISLNSPSSQIVGTPFASDNTRFEYPFPDTSQSCSSGSSPATPHFTPSSSASSTSFPILSLPTQPLGYYPKYQLIHPKMKVLANPPIPPTLFKRRPRWNVQRWKPTS